MPFPGSLITIVLQDNWQRQNKLRNRNDLLLCMNLNTVLFAFFPAISCLFEGVRTELIVACGRGRLALYKPVITSFQIILIQNALQKVQCQHKSQVTITTIARELAPSLA